MIWNCDLSSDVCSSNLILKRIVEYEVSQGHTREATQWVERGLMSFDNQPGTTAACFLGIFSHRLPDLIVKNHQDKVEVASDKSEERRVGKECRSRLTAYDMEL